MSAYNNFNSSYLLILLYFTFWNLSKVLDTFYIPRRSIYLAYCFLSLLRFLYITTFYQMILLAWRRNTRFEMNWYWWKISERNAQNITKIKEQSRETALINKSLIRALQLKIILKILDEYKKRRHEQKAVNDDFRICGDTCPLKDSGLVKINKQFAKSSKLKTIRIHNFSLAVKQTKT